MDETFTAKVVEYGGRKRIAFNAVNYYQTKLNKLEVGTKLWVNVTSHEPTRSDAQNRLYWTYLHMIGQETGNDTEALHEHFARRYLALPPTVVRLPGGELSEVRARKSTTTLSKAAFSVYMSQIERDSGVPIPDTELFKFGRKEEQHDIRNTEAYPDSDDISPKF